MFQNSLMIIKPDYLHKRRPVLLKLLAEEFQIQAQRKVNFSPELAAEFYADFQDETGFMLQVILLSKGTSEAFILTKENGVEDLLNIMICYFGSASEMEGKMHVTKHADNVAREINFIFPNYIHEPTPLFDRNTFCNRPMLKPLISEIYDIMQNADCSQDNWKVRVSDYLARTNPALPQVSNQCTLRPEVGLQDRAQQTIMTYKSPAKSAKPDAFKSVPSTPSLVSSTSPHSSLLLTSSSCVTCGGFERTEPCFSDLDLNKRLEPQSDEKICEEEEIIWKEVIIYEEVVPEEEEQGFRDYIPHGEEEDEGEGGGDKFGGMHSDVESDRSVEVPMPKAAPPKPAPPPPPPAPEPEEEDEPPPPVPEAAPEPQIEPEPPAPEPPAPEPAAPEPPEPAPAAPEPEPAPEPPAPEPEPEPEPEPAAEEAPVEEQAAEEAEEVQEAQVEEAPAEEAPAEEVPAD